MEKWLFFDIDTQNDFMNPDGALYVPGAIKIKHNLSEIINFAKESSSYIVASVDAHEINDPEFKEFPPHCIKNTYGQEKIIETKLDNPTIIPVNYQGEINLNSKQFILEKNVFDVFSNENTEKLLKKINPDRIFVFGVATDYCVEAAVLGLIRRYNNVSIVTDAVKGIYEYKCYRFFEEAENLGITLSTTDELLKGKLCVLQ